MDGEENKSESLIVLYFSLLKGKWEKFKAIIKY